MYGARLRPTTFVPVLPTSLRSDTHGGVNVGELTAGVVGILVVVLILTALLPTIIDAIDNSTLTGASLALLGLIPLLIIVAVLLSIVAWMMATGRIGGYHGGE